jgi:hypothetical protein
MNTYQKTAQEFQEQFMRHWESKGCFHNKCITLLDLCDETLQKMKDQVLEKGFESLNDEIRFFKEVKPKILSVKFACRTLMEYEFERVINQYPKKKSLTMACNGADTATSTNTKTSNWNL